MREVRGAGKRPIGVVVIVIIAALEAIVALAAAVMLVVGLATGQDSSLAGTAMLILLSFAAAAWIVILVRALWRGSASSRGGLIVVQLIVIAIAVGAFQGGRAFIGIGLAYFVPAAVVLGLLFTKPVIGATTAKPEPC